MSAIFLAFNEVVVEAVRRDVWDAAAALLLAILLLVV
jgi:hypothetical protein